MTYAPSFILGKLSLENIALKKERTKIFLFISPILLYPRPALITHFAALLTPFPKIPFKNSGAANNERIRTPCLSLTSFTKIPFTEEEPTGGINKES